MVKEDSEIFKVNDLIKEYSSKKEENKEKLKEDSKKQNDKVNELIKENSKNQNKEFKEDANSVLWTQLKKTNMFKKY